MKTLIATFAAFLFTLGSAFSQVDYKNSVEDSIENSEAFMAMNEDMVSEHVTSDTKPTPVNKITKFAEFKGKDNQNVNDFISSNITFPEEARLIGSSGIVKVQFDIYPNGSIGNIHIIESPDVSFNREVKALLENSPVWRPAYSGDVPVTSRYQLNIDFSLQ